MLCKNDVKMMAKMIFERAVMLDMFTCSPLFIKASKFHFILKC